MYMRPSAIQYSQDSIGNHFDSRSRHSHKLLGETVNDISDGKINISSIPTITVVKINGKWYTEDNRRLWVFRQLQMRGKCFSVPVHVCFSGISDQKFTTSCGGDFVRVRGDPWPSSWWGVSYESSSRSLYRPPNEEGSNLWTCCRYCCWCLIFVVILLTILAAYSSSR